MKPPDAPSPSGDRTLARLFLAALTQAGFDPVLASRLRTWNGTGDEALQHRLQTDSDVQVRSLLNRWTEGEPSKRPSLWFTYHCYWKAPDLLGPRVARALGIPYVVAEPIRSQRRASGPWASGHAAAEAALDRAQVLLPLTRRDLGALEARKVPGQTIALFPPFTDLSAAEAREREARGPTRLVTIGMMRPDAKRAAFLALAQALSHLQDRHWVLNIVGDGPSRVEVEGWFARFGSRVRFLGRIEDRDEVARHLAEAEVFVWPAEREAFGMAYLEAQACGCAVVGTRVGGVPEALLEGRTGFLVDPGDPRAFAEAIRRLVDDPILLRRLRQEARLWVAGSRSQAAASSKLRGLLDGLVAKQAA